MEYLVTDIRTLVETWVAAASLREALIAHENAGRAQKLPASTKASSYSTGAIIDMSIGESVIRGRRENVTRAA